MDVAVGVGVSLPGLNLASMQITENGVSISIAGLETHKTWNQLNDLVEILDRDTPISIELAQDFVSALNDLRALQLASEMFLQPYLPEDTLQPTWIVIIVGDLDQEEPPEDMWFVVPSILNDDGDM